MRSVMFGALGSLGAKALKKGLETAAYVTEVVAPVLHDAQAGDEDMTPVGWEDETVLDIEPNASHMTGRPEESYLHHSSFMSSRPSPLPSTSPSHHPSSTLESSTYVDYSLPAAVRPLAAMSAFHSHMESPKNIDLSPGTRLLNQGFQSNSNTASEPLLSDVDLQASPRLNHEVMKTTEVHISPHPESQLGVNGRVDGTSTKSLVSPRAAINVQSSLIGSPREAVLTSGSPPTKNFQMQRVENVDPVLPESAEVESDTLGAAGFRVNGNSLQKLTVADTYSKHQFQYSPSSGGNTPRTNLNSHKWSGDHSSNSTPRNTAGDLRTHFSPHFIERRVVEERLSPSPVPSEIENGTSPFEKLAKDNSDAELFDSPRHSAAAKALDDQTKALADATMRLEVQQTEIEYLRSQVEALAREQSDGEGKDEIIHELQEELRKERGRGNMQVEKLKEELDQAYARLASESGRAAVNIEYEAQLEKADRDITTLRDALSKAEGNVELLRNSLVHIVHALQPSSELAVPLQRLEAKENSKEAVAAVTDGVSKMARQRASVQTETMECLRRCLEGLGAERISRDVPLGPLLEHMTRAVSETVERFTEVCQERDSLQHQIDPLSQQVTSLQHQLHAIQQRNDQELSQKDRTLNQYKQVIDQMRAAGRGATDEAQRLQEEREGLTKMLHDIGEENDSLKKQVAEAHRYRHQVEAGGEELEKLKDQLQAALRQVEASADEMSENARKEASLRQQASTAQQLANELSGRLQVVEADLQVAAADRQRAEMALHSMQGVLEQFQAERATESEAWEQRFIQEQQAATHMLKVKEQTMRAAIEKEIEVAKEEGRRKLEAERQSLDAQRSEYNAIKQEVIQLRAALDTTKRSLLSSEGELLDRRLVANLLVRYVSSRHDKKVLELLSRIAGFTDEDQMAVGLLNSGPGLGTHIIHGLFNIITGSGEDDSEPPGAMKSEDIHGDTLKDAWLNYLLAESGEDSQVNSPQRPK